MFALVLAAVSAFVQAFAGSWLCHSQNAVVPWNITGTPGGSWTTVSWGNQQGVNAGVAMVGYVPALGKWVYRDFHYDGSYADITGVQNGNQWRWTGPYYSGTQQLNGDILWTLSSHGRIDRAFRSVINGKLTPSGTDYCVRAPAAASPL